MTLLKLALKNITARPGRFLLTSLAVLVGVALTCSVFILTDSWRETFGNLSSDIESGYDLAVRSSTPFGERQDAAPIPLSVADDAASTTGVASVQPRVIDFTSVPNKGDGTAVETLGGPIIALNWEDITPEPRLFLGEGRPPEADDEFVVDVDMFVDDEFVLGDTYDIQTPAGIRSFTLVGTFTFADPEQNATVGAKLFAISTNAAVDVFNAGSGYDDLTISLEAGADREATIAALASNLPEGIEVLTLDELVEEQEEGFNDIVNIFRTILLVFAFVILLVAAFIIYNVFSIIVGQRIQEIGLLRALGATGKQITRSIAAEAFGVGVFATITGILLALPIAFGLQKALAAVDFGPDDAKIPLRPTTIIVGAVLGIGLTLAAAVWPALKARMVSPMAALRADVSDEGGTPHNPQLGWALTAIGVALVIVGFVLNSWGAILLFTVLAGIFIYAGLSRVSAIGGRFSLVGLAVVLLIVALSANLRTSVLLALLGAAAFTAFVGMNLLAPLFARSVARAIGAPIAAIGGIPSKLARENAGRSPDRTATAASALMIGLALVTAVAVLAESFKATFADVLRESVSSDWIVLGDQQGPVVPTFSPELAISISSLPEIEEAVGVQFRASMFRTSPEESAEDPYSMDLTKLENHFDIGLIDVDKSLYGDRAAIIFEDEAEDLGVGVGDTIEVELIDESRLELVVAGIYSELAIFDSGWLIDTSVYDRMDTGLIPGDAFVSMLQAAGFDEATTRAAIEAAASDFPQLDVKTKADFQQDTENSINQVLQIINLLLFVSIVLAVLGIAITLALSVFERTREIGLIRAVGATRKQVKRMIRVEGLIVALFGGVLGVGLGLVFGIAVVQIIPDDFVSTLAIPWGSMITSAIVAAIAGLLAAIFPARRASKLNVLEAISHGG